MSEGSFVIIIPKSQDKKLDKLLAFLNENGIEGIEQSSTGRYRIISAKTDFELSPKKVVSFLQNLLEENDWYRLYENNEYGTETFWYVDQKRAWRTQTEQDEPNHHTLSAYTNWHQGLEGITYGVLEPSQLRVLEEKYGLFDSAGNPVTDPVSFRSLINSGTTLFGKNLTVPHAGKYWDWYIPDYESLAKGIALHCLADDQTIHYRRSYMVEGDIGYVWSWSSGQREVFLIFVHFGEFSYCQRIVSSDSDLTSDEAILAAYYDNDLPEAGKPTVVAPPTDEYQHTPLDTIDISPFDAPSWVNIFDGRVISPHTSRLVRCDEKYYLYDRWQESDTRIEIQDRELDEQLKREMPEIYAQLGAGLYLKPKILMKNRHEIAKLLAAKFLDYSDEDEELVIAELAYKAVYATTV